MNRSGLRTALAALAFVAVPAAVVAAHETPLSKVAAELGYTYSYLGPEDAVALARAGVTIVVRPGERLFDVNDRTEAMDGAAPRFYHSDIFVSDALVARLRQIAARYPANASFDRPVAAASMQGASGITNATGAIGELSVSQVPGRQEIAVLGKAPPNLPIILTLVSTFSTEIPDVVLSRHEVTSGADGAFATNLPIASGFFRGNILTLVATSRSGISPAKTQIVMKGPNGTVTIPADQEPSSIR